MGAIAVPILPGKVDAWKEWGAELKGPRADEFADFNSRFGLTRHRAYLQQNPDGGYVVIAIHDGPGGDEFMQKAAESDHPFDVEVRGKVEEFHGIDLTAPPGPPPELWLDA